MVITLRTLSNTKQRSGQETARKRKKDKIQHKSSIDEAASENDVSVAVAKAV